MVNKKSLIIYIIAVGASIFLLLFVVTNTWIGFEVKNQCNEAVNRYGGDCVEALSATLDDDSNSFRKRNDAIWALGQLGDERALPILEKYYTGNIPEREPLNGTISQYELKKAVNLTSGGLNISAFIWRNGIL